MRSMKVFAFLASVAAAATVDDESRFSRRQDDEDDNSDEKKDPFRQRALQQVVTMGNHLYFNGGEMSNYYNGTKEDGAFDSSTMNVTMAVSLSKSWNNESIEFIYTEHPEMDSINSFALWADPAANRLYRWGGSMAREADMPEDGVNLWAFAADGDGSGTWEIQDPFDPDVFDDIVGAMGGASTYCNGRGYYIGGLGRASTDARFESIGQDGIPVPGMLSYRFERREWRNESTVPMNAPYGEIINAEAHCATGFEKVKDESLVFLIGGAKTARDDASQTVPNSMTNVTFWNPDGNSWHAQRTSGEAPSAREHFCVAGARGSDSYEIFVYGGENPKTGTSGMIHILSLPAFRWFKTDVSSPGRIHHSCTVAGNRQMISTGGVGSEWDWEDQDPWRHSIGVFDMTDLEWKDRFDSDAEGYQTPQMIRDWYGENTNWMRDLEWDDSEVEAIFSDITNRDPDDPSWTSSPSDSSSTPTGAIAGGVVGGVAGLALIGGLIFFFLRRRRRAAHQAIELESPASPDVPGTSHAPDGLTPDYKGADLSSSSPSTQFGGLANTTLHGSPANSHGPYAGPDGSAGGAWVQTAPVEMATTEHGGGIIEMPTAGHERVEMEDNSRKELVG